MGLSRRPRRTRSLHDLPASNRYAGGVRTFEWLEARRLLSINALAQPADVASSAAVVARSATAGPSVAASASVLSAGSVLAAASATPSQLASPVADASGNFVMRPGVGAITLPSSLLTNPEVTGFVLRDTWANVNPAPGVYDWSRLDAAISTTVAAGKEFKLVILTGTSAPTWLYSQGVQSMTFVDNGSGSVPAGTYTMPVPWDPTMLADYGNLLTAMYQHFGSNSNLVAVDLGGPTRYSVETHLPNEVMSLPGYSPNLIVNAWSTVFEEFASEPWHARGAVDLSNAFNAADGIAPQVAANAVSILGDHVSLQDDALNALSTLPSYNIQQLVVHYAQLGVFTGYEEVYASTQAGFGGSFSAAWQTLLNSGGRFVNLYTPDDQQAQAFPPGFLEGPDVAVNDNAGAVVMAGWASDVELGFGDNVTQSLQFQTTTDRPDLFVTLPTVAANGSLSFVPAAQASGMATVWVSLQGIGASGPTSTSTQQMFQITFNAPPTASIVGPLGDGTVGAGLSFASSVSDPDSSAFSFAWIVSLNGQAAASASTPTFQFTPTAGGSYSVQLIVTDSDGASGSATTAVQVDPASTVTGLSVAGLSGSGTAVWGQSVSLTAMVAALPLGAGTPSGTVIFLDNGTSIGSGSLALVNGSLQAVYTTSTLAVGSHSITAEYSGDGNFAPSVSAAATQTVSLAATATTLTSSGVALSGLTAKFTATVSVTAPGAGAPTGTVTFLDNGLPIGSGSLTALGGTYQASFSTTALAVGNHSITATYSGDGNFATSTSAATILAGNSAATTTSLAGSWLTFSGQTAMFTATVAVVAPGAGVPTGTVTFLDNGTPIGSGPLMALAGAYQASFSTATLSIGGHSITAIYGGDANFAISTSAAGYKLVDAAATTTTIVGSGPISSGQTATFTATVSVAAPGKGAPTGTISFLDNGTPIGSAPLTMLAGICQASFSTTVLSVGSHSITATYSGDANFLGSASTAAVQRVAPIATTTSLVGSGAIVSGQVATFMATVAPSGQAAGVPTGMVTFFDNGLPVGSGPLTAVAGIYQANWSSAALSVGSHSITATYSGDGSFVTSTTSALPAVVNQAASTVGLTSSIATPVSGQPVTFTATVAVAAPGAATPGGTVVFMDGSTTLGSGTLTLVGSQLQTSITVTSLSVGSHSITAGFGGNSVLASSASMSLSELVSKASSTTALLASTGSTISGQPVTLTATVAVAAPGAATPGGTVVFMDGGTTLGSGTLTLVGSQMQTSITVTSSSIGNHSITAVFGGSSTLTASISPSVSEVVSKDSSTTTLVSSVSTPVSGQPVTLTATVGTVAPGTAPVTGTVSFKDGGIILGSGTLTVVGSQWQATITLPSLAIGRHSLTAIYGGNNTVAGSASSGLSFVVGKAATTTTLASSLDPSTQGQAVFFTAIVGVASPGAGTPTGAISFKDGTSTLGTAVVSTTAGVTTATFGTASLAVGMHSVTAVYAGDGNYRNSSSAVVLQQVNSTANVKQSTAQANTVSPAALLSAMAAGGSPAVVQASGSLATATGSSLSPSGAPSAIAGRWSPRILNESPTSPAAKITAAKSTAADLVHAAALANDWLW
jgi:hypothetical protein